MQLSLNLENIAKDYFLSIFKGSFSGVGMGKIGMYPFFMHHNAYKAIEENLSATFGSFFPIKGQEIVTDSGGYSNYIRLNGVLVAENINSLKPLEWYLKQREKIRFTTISYDVECLITSLSTTKSFFTIVGEHRVQTYNISLKVLEDSYVL